MRIIFHALLLFVILLVCPVLSLGQNKDTCVVLSFSTDDKSPIGYGSMLANEISSQISISRRITVIPRTTVNKISADLKIPVSNIIQSASSKTKLYEAMGCDVIVVGSISGEKENIKVLAYIFSKKE